jgi:hypothetical protein
VDPHFWVLPRGNQSPKLRSDPEVWSHGMPNRPIPFPSRTNPGSGSVFIRKLLILNVASLRYELDVICILTPVPPKPRTKLAVLAPAC